MLKPPERYMQNSPFETLIACSVTSNSNGIYNNNIKYDSIELKKLINLNEKKKIPHNMGFSFFKN